MNLPEWVDPASPDDPRAAAAAPGREGAGSPLGVEDPELAEKPVLEWTKDDWARWVLGGVAAAGTEVAGAETVVEAGAEPPAAVEAEVEAEAETLVGAGAEPPAPVEVEAETRAARGPDGQGQGHGEMPAAWPASVVVEPADDHAGPADDDGPEQPIVDIRLPEEDDLLVPPPPLPGDDGAWDPPLSSALALGLDDGDPAAAPATGPTLFGPRPQGAPWGDLGGGADLPDAGADDAGGQARGGPPAADPGAEGELHAAAGGQPDDDRPWDDEVEFDRRADLWAGQGAGAGADGAAEPDDEPWAGPPGDRWSGARSAPAALDPDTLAIPVATPEGAGPALAPASAAWPTGTAGPPGGRPPAPAAPARRGGRGRSRLEAEPAEDDRSRRVRSLIGLLCLAVTVGVLIAALVTVTIVALGLALRRTVG